MEYSKQGLALTEESQSTQSQAVHHTPPCSLRRGHNDSRHAVVNGDSG